MIINLPPPRPPLSKQLETGADPATCYCRICGVQAIPPYPGYIRDAVCSKECFDEWKWRETLHILGKKYYPRPTT